MDTPHTRHDNPRAMPLQAHPIRRDDPGTTGVHARTGVGAALSSCATMTGPARQMCYASQGVST